MEYNFIGLGLMAGGLLALLLFNLPMMRFWTNLEHKRVLQNANKQLQVPAQKFRKKADALLKKSWAKFRFPFLVALLVQLLVLVLPFSLQTHLQIAGGYWLIFLLCYVNADVRFWPAHLKAVRLFVAQKAIRPSQLADSEAVLLRAALRTDPTVRLSVATVLRDLNTEKSLRMLNKLSQDRDENVAAAANESIEILEKISPKSPVPSQLTFQDALTAHQALHPKPDVNRDELASLEKVLDDLQAANAASNAQIQTMYCPKCLLRPERKTYLRWNFPNCPKCNASDSIFKGIEKVV